MKKTIVLAILDGYGLRDNEHGNAIKLANNQMFNQLWQEYPHTKLQASGQFVGLPKGQMGNSEVGHMNIGAGRIVYQPLELINSSIEDKTIFSNEKILEVMNHVKKNKSKLHFIGLLSDGGVHSHINHLISLLEMCKKENISDVCLHLFTDGRDTAPKSSHNYISRIETKLKELNIGKISTIGGRYYGMDRDNNYDRLQKAYDVIVNDIGIKQESIEVYINNNYSLGITDEFFLPAKFQEHQNISDNDGVIAFNFRKDRLREIMTAITNPEEVPFKAKKFQNIKVITMLPVVHTVKADHAFDDPKMTNILGEYIEKIGLSQLRIAETEKYAHVTFFFDGGKEISYNNEDKVLIPSPKVATYDLKPEMSCEEITEKLLSRLGKYDLIILNYANGDMVGHTGNLQAAIKAVETVDKSLRLIYNRVREIEGILIVTADHGNCEEMLDEKNNILTAHTTNPVPFIVTKKGLKLKEGKLADIAPTILELMNVEKPLEMTGSSLIKKDC